MSKFTSKIAVKSWFVVLSEVFLIICFKVEIRVKSRKESSHCATVLRNMTMKNEYIINQYHVSRKRHDKATFENVPKHDGYLTSRGLLTVPFKNDANTMNAIKA